MLARLFSLAKATSRPKNQRPTGPTTPFPPRKRWTLLVLVAAIATAFVFHREPNRSSYPLDAICESWDPSVDPGNNAPPFPDRCASIKRIENSQIAFVEFDDQGDYFDQRQSFAALRLIRQALEEPKSAVEVFVFVHGWQHSAHPEDEHVKQFTRFLSARGTPCTAQNACLQKKTIGIFVGWPGKTLRFPLNATTFWSRKAAAHRIANGSVQEFFATLAQVKIDHETRASNKKIQPSYFRTYIIGHSFGGLIAFQANSQSLAVRYGSAVLESRGQPEVTKVGDLLILINPAIEALRFTALNSLWSEYSNDPFYSPAMVVVGSRTDYATKYLFPIGVAAGTLFTNQIRASQWSDALTTVGNAEGYLTHNAYFDASGQIEVCERPHPLSFRKAPFWFVSANPNLVDGHGDLNAEKLLSMFSRINGLVEEQILGGLPRCDGPEQ